MRIRLLCEDRAQEGLADRFCAARGIRIVKREVAPNGKGAASAWVLARYAKSAQAFRALANAQPSLGMLVLVDGDDRGVRDRMTTLARKLEGSPKGAGRPRGGSERIAVFVPTWSTETWVLWLAGHRDVDEVTKYKHDPRVSACSVGSGAALDQFLRGEAPGLPSLMEARTEVRRLP
jgi:hypothetical protein